MEVGLSTASYFGKMQIEDAVTDIGAHGVRVCELFLNSFSEYEPDFVDMLKKRLDDARLSAYSVHPMGIQFEPLLFSQHSRQRADSLSIYENVLRAAQRLGAGVYVMHGAANLSGAAMQPDFCRLADIFAELIALAENYGVTLSLENVSWCLFNRPEFGVRLSEAIGDHKLKFTLDVKQAARMGLTVLDFIDAVGSDAVNLHLCGASALPSGGCKLSMPGQDQTDFVAIRDALARKGYHGPAFLEVYGSMFDDPAALYDSLAAMRAIFTAI